MERVEFETHPSRYSHWNLSFEGEVARLAMNVQTEHAHREGYELKLNSYDLSVDIELSDAIARIRFEHPEVRVVVVTADIDRVFCSGANIYMLGSSTHSFKVNFCKFTNETRLYMEDASTHSGIKFLAALNGTCAGGGYELALACDDIVLIDDGSSAVSFPETPLLAVLPGTGGLTRLVDKRKVRRDRADVFCTLAEGIKGRRAVEWGLVDGLARKSKFDEEISTRAETLADTVRDVPHGPAVELTSLSPAREDDAVHYQFVDVEMNRDERVATLTVKAPSAAPPEDVDGIVAEGANLWALRAFRELDDALLNLRFNEPLIGTIMVRTSGNAEWVQAADRGLAAAAKTCGFAREVLLLQARVLRAFDLTAKSFFAVIDEGSCFSGSLLELALGSDRMYMLEDEDEQVSVWLSEANTGSHPTSSGLSRLQVHFYGDEARVTELLGRGHEQRLGTLDADEIGIPTMILDDIDFEDELRVAVEERASLSPDALTGMEASLRFPGPETLETKIFGRLSAWQNWIFTRPNATGEQGALTLYGKPARPTFNWNRT